MKKDTSYSFQSKKGMEVTFEELHIRHINLLIDIKNKELNNWFLKMAIINTFDDLKIFLNNLKKNKNKCIIAIYGNEIIGYLNINVAVVDVNDLGGVKVLASSNKTVNKILKRNLISNPAGNGDEKTPIVLIREKK